MAKEQSAEQSAAAEINKRVRAQFGPAATAYTHSEAPRSIPCSKLSAQ